MSFPAFRAPGPVPDSFEDHVMVQGPSVFACLVSEVGGRAAAIEASGLASSTWARWLQRSPGHPFGPGGRSSMRRSLWFGYPAPFPGLDRCMEQICGPESSFLQVLVGQKGWVGAYGVLEKPEGFGLVDVGVTWPDIERLEFIPHTTRRRLFSSSTMSKSLVCLDRLARACGRLGWFEAVASYQGSPARVRAVPMVALRALVESVRLPGQI